MGEYFRADLLGEDAGISTVKVRFVTPASNTELVPDAISSIRALGLTGGRGIHLDGPMSIPVAVAVAHAVGHLFGYVACFDPKLEGFVIAISHHPDFKPGQLIPAVIQG